VCQMGNSVVQTEHKLTVGPVPLEGYFSSIPI
jgi:hypothetical protein